MELFLTWASTSTEPSSSRRCCSPTPTWTSGLSILDKAPRFQQAQLWFGDKNVFFSDWNLLQSCFWAKIPMSENYQQRFLCYWMQTKRYGGKKKPGDLKRRKKPLTYVFFKSRPKCVIGVVDFSSLGWKNSEKIEPRRQRRVVLYLTCFRRRLHRRRRHTKSFACFAAVVVVVVVVVVVRACKSQKERCAVQQEQQMKQQHRFWLLLSCSEFSRIPAGH